MFKQKDERDNSVDLDLSDGFETMDEERNAKVIRKLRNYQRAHT